MKVLKKRLNRLKYKILKSKKLKKNEQKLILYNIEIILKQGYSLNECIKLLNNKMDLNFILDELSQGEKFTDTLKKLKFDNDILLILEISEKSGQILNGIIKANKIILQKEKNKNNILERLKYPIILGIILVFAIYFMTNLLLPMFKDVYTSFGIEVGIKLKIFVVILEGIPNVVFSLIILLILLSLYIKIQEQSDILKIIMKNKLIKKQYYKIYNQIFLINLCSLLELNIRLDEIFSVFSHQKYNFLLRYESKAIYNSLIEGEELSYILCERNIYNKEIINAIEDGQKYNTLVSNLKNMLIIQEVENEKKAQRLLFLIQPMFYLFFGLIIILLYISIFAPMFKIMDEI